MDWLKVAEGLPVGGSIKVRHDCSPSGSPSLSIYNDPEAYRGWCHRCKEKLWHPKELTLGEKIALAAAAREADHAARIAGDKPAGTADWRDWPKPAYVWLLKAGISEAMSTDMGIVYDPNTRRVILPYGNHWQGRAVFPEQKPKYIGPKRQPAPVLLIPDHEARPLVPVLVEDLLSAYKLRSQGYYAMPLLGTNLSDTWLAALLRYTRHADVPKVVVWTDPDKPGRDCAAAVCARLGIFGFATLNVLSERDPKLHTAAEVGQFLDRWCKATRFDLVGGG